MVLPGAVLGLNGATSPNEKLNVAGIGIGGQGGDDLGHMEAENIVALCDVDKNHAAHIFKKYSKAKQFTDYRKMLDEMKEIDGVVVATPDHHHAFASIEAIKRGKHVYCEKPLTHSVWEARQVATAAHAAKVVTQMGNQGASNDGTRLMSEWYDAGLIGDVHTVYCWTNRPVWPQGIAWPKTKAEVPSTLDWNLWLGNAPYKDFVDNLVPFNWRGWWDYGTGALGDMGCHLVEAPFRVLDLEYVKDVQVCHPR